MNAPFDNLFASPPPRRRAIDARAVRQAFASLIEALDITDAADAQTPDRAAALWVDHLIAGQHADLAAALGPALRSEQHAPIVIEPLGFHIVCPHHLTVASGTASIAYWPAGQIVGFGRVAKLVEVATARLALQEEATADIAKALMHVLQAQAVVVRLRAEHLCHTVLHPRSHGAKATTWGFEGDAALLPQLQSLLSA
jgi:GTP cyclohydrolase I